MTPTIGVRVRKIMLIQSSSCVRASLLSMMTPPKVGRITFWAGIIFATSVVVAAFAADEIETIRKAQALLERGDAAAASPLLEGAVARTPKSAELHYLLARSYTLEAKQSSNAVRPAF